MVANHFWLLFAVLLSGPKLSINLPDNKSGQRGLQGDCSIRSCNVPMEYSGSPSFVARLNRHPVERSFVLKLEYSDENSATKEITPPFEMKLVSGENGTQECE